MLLLSHNLYLSLIYISLSFVTLSFCLSFPSLSVFLSFYISLFFLTLYFSVSLYLYLSFFPSLCFSLYISNFPTLPSYVSVSLFSLYYCNHSLYWSIPPFLWFKITDFFPKHKNVVQDLVFLIKIFLKYMECLQKIYCIQILYYT